MKTQKISARVGAILMLVHGLLEVSGLFFSITAIQVAETPSPQYMTHFGGLRPEEIEANTLAIAILGAIWGISRFFAVWGCWSLQKWALALGVILNLATLVNAISIFPAGVMDTMIAAPVLILLLYAWFGDERVPVDT